MGTALGGRGSAHTFEQPSALVLPIQVQAPITFHALLALAADAAALAEQAARARGDEEPVLSLAMPLRGLDPLAALPQLGSETDDGFRFLWDGAPGLCLAASGRCNSLELSGPRRFELAQRFSALSLSRLALAPATLPAMARPRVLLAFSFFDGPQLQSGGAPGVQAVLPRWQLSRQGRHCWLRLQRGLGGGVTARQVVEELWEAAQRLESRQQGEDPGAHPPAQASVLAESDWRQGYGANLERALELVEQGTLRKLVLAVRQELCLDRNLDPLLMLGYLRNSQPGSCRFLWQRSPREALLGASPERLLTVRQGQLRCDALAGTAPRVAAADLLLSDKDRREHELVVEAITTVLQQLGLQPRRSRHPRLARHGALVHLHTPITAALSGQPPLTLAEALHPTPAVAGLPRRDAMNWLRSLEPFERGHYAAPIGWIDTAGDTDLRVAIRSGTVRGDRLELTAGAGLVPGSQAERERQEVALKLEVLRQQLTLLQPR